MNAQADVLIVDDTPQNIRLLEAMLTPHGYHVIGAASGQEALTCIATEQPSLILLDVVMPGMDGFEVCRQLRSNSDTHLLPVIMITASDDRDKTRALEVGADDFVHKPFDQTELLARVASLVRIKKYHDTIQHQAAELTRWNQLLEARVSEQVADLDRLGRLRRFLSAPVADILVSAEGEALLESHRCQIAVLSCHLRGFIAFAESNDPEDVLAVLREYHEGLGAAIVGFEATIGPLLEDRLTLLFNDPLPTDDPPGKAVKAALAMRNSIEAPLVAWRRSGYELDFGIGIDLGYATLGTMVFAGRTEYGAFGTVVHLAARLAEAARNCQILVSHRVQVATQDMADVSALGEHAFTGFARPVPVYAIERNRMVNQAPPSDGTTSPTSLVSLTAREREVVDLIVRGYTNREIATELVIAESTAVRHVANILSKLNLKSRARVAVWAVERGVTQSTRSPGVPDRAEW